MLEFNQRVSSVFLNRACPRKCTQCGVKLNKKKHLTIPQWKEIFKFLKDEVGVEFHIIYGTEPLVFKDGLVELVRFFADEQIEYALYSTSPEPLFSKYAQKLVDAGLKNWSCGIDSLPGRGWTDLETEKKVADGIKGLMWMSEHGVDVEATITVTNYNLSHLVDIVSWLQDNIPGILTILNPIESQRNPMFDFFTKEEHMKDMLIPGTRREEYVDVMQKVLELTRKKGYKIQNLDLFFVESSYYFDRLSHRCNGVCGFAIDCDGSLRLCAYSTGSRMPRYTIWDVMNKQRRGEVLLAFRQDAQECSGCYWNLIPMMELEPSALYLDSDYFKSRHEQPLFQIRDYLKGFEK